MGKVALVVPGRMGEGGVPTVANFLADVIEGSGEFTHKLITLSSDWREPENLRITDPRTWIKGGRASNYFWQGREWIHIGASWAEFEFQRSQPRALLSRVLEDCDLVQVVCGSPCFALAVCGLGKPVAVQCATRAEVERRTKAQLDRGIGGAWRRAMTKITNRLDDRAIGAVDLVQVENDWMERYARSIRVGREDSVVHMPPGVDDSIFLPGGPRGAARPYILSVGRFADPRKNPGLLLSAFERVAKAYPEVDLILAGSNGPLTEFWARVRRGGLEARVKFIERPSNAELVRLYQGAAVFALPSDEEGLGLVVLEAMACGVPAVATRCGGPDGIISDGRDGLLVPVGNPDAMAKALGGLLADPALAEKIGEAGRATVERRFSLKVAGEAFLASYRQILVPRVGHASWSDRE